MTWDQSDANPIADIAAVKRAIEAGAYRPLPDRPILHPRWQEWPYLLAFTGYPDVLDRTRPWPRIVLFPRWDAAERAIRRRIRRLRWRIEDTCRGR
jgi:hypothetical protein